MPVSELKSLRFKILWLPVSNVVMWSDAEGVTLRSLALWHLDVGHLGWAEAGSQHLILHMLGRQCTGITYAKHEKVNGGTSLRLPFPLSLTQLSPALDSSGKVGFIVACSFLVHQHLKYAFMKKGEVRANSDSCNNSLVDGALTHTKGDVDLMWETRTSNRGWEGACKERPWMSVIQHWRHSAESFASWRAHLPFCSTHWLKREPCVCVSENTNASANERWIRMEVAVWDIVVIGKTLQYDVLKTVLLGEVKNTEQYC